MMVYKKLAGKARAIEVKVSSWGLLALARDEEWSSEQSTRLDAWCPAYKSIEKY
ncbi:hypothetical protein QUA89_33070 [Microcoleus sp. F10-B4]|jgi:hypothetical protein|uniref:hypothetical protein n=1 Tax=unclassified Microcoleus TaxID=2642155 RepID=UPI002FD254AB